MRAMAQPKPLKCKYFILLLCVSLIAFSIIIHLKVPFSILNLILFSYLFLHYIYILKLFVFFSIFPEFYTDNRTQNPLYVGFFVRQ